MPEHRVGFLQLSRPPPNTLDRQLRRRRHRRHLLLRVREELVQGRVQEPHRYRRAIHDQEELNEVVALHLQQLRARRPPTCLVQGQDHLPHGNDPISFEEHVLCADEADAVGTEPQSRSGVCGRLRVRPHPHAAQLVRPSHDRPEIAAQLRRDSWHLAQHDLAGAAVNGQHVAGSHHQVVDVQRLRSVVHPHTASAGNAWPAHATRHHGRMARHAATRRQDPLGRMNAMDVLGARLDAHQQHGLALIAEPLCLVRSEDHLAASRAGRRRQALCDDTLRRGGVQHGVQELVEALRLQAHDRLLLRDQALLRHVHGHAQGRRRRALPSPRLEHVQLPPLNGELNVLHVPKMLLQLPADALKLLEDLWHRLLQGWQLGVRSVRQPCRPSELLRRADARDDVLALRVD
mmetsp:Transcript_94484/g.273100  ORF Transcript_94484/g.273100 Transcript_94484/m.273100 type:complete len:404 (+) Transcript_94484:1261-2472(+)